MPRVVVCVVLLFLCLCTSSSFSLFSLLAAFRGEGVGDGVCCCCCCSLGCVRCCCCCSSVAVDVVGASAFVPFPPSLLSRASFSSLSLFSIAIFLAACFAFPIRPNIFSCTSLVTSLLFSLPKVKLTSFARLFSASSLLCSSLKSIPPNAPSLGVTINARIAVNAVLTDQLGCQCSAWYDVIDKQIFVNVSNLPFGVKSIKFGGLNGYSTGSKMRPWYRLQTQCLLFDYGAGEEREREREIACEYSTRNRQHSERQQREKEAQTHKHEEQTDDNEEHLSSLAYLPRRISQSATQKYRPPAVPPTWQTRCYPPSSTRPSPVVGRRRFHLPSAFRSRGILSPLERCVERRCSRRRI